jgi:GNAT superfamily N-acetyltransferase
MKSPNINIKLGEGVSLLNQSEVDIHEVSALIIEQILKNPYYTVLAKSSEIVLYTPAILEQMLATDPYAVLIAQSKEGIVTGVLVNKFDCYTRWMNWVLVRPEYKRMGYATRLIEALKIVAQETHCHKVWCDSRPTNTESLGLLNKNNFKEITKLYKHWYSLDFVLLEYNLSKTHG